MSTDMTNLGIKGKSIQKSECARLENAKYLSDLTMLHLLAEEASLKAEIGFLNVCTEVQSIELDEAVFDLLSKALHQLECCEEDEKQLSKASVLSSSSVYWNELSPFTGVFPQRLIDRLLQVRKTLDATAVSLQNLEIFYELHSGGL
ncbi:hypothetical protein TSMEX_004465 [Taenia solium]|eukprot:TsM_000028200 transcript=TsM_000028200 gene=TsM_000028200